MKGKVRVSDNMKIFPIEESSRLEEDPESTWTPDCPNLVLVVIDQGRCRLIDHCGRLNEHESDYGELRWSVEEDGWELADGVWVVPGEPNYHKDYYGEVDGSWDLTGEPRRLTNEEWDLFKGEESPWELEWYAPEPVDNTTCSAPIPSCGTCEGDVDRWVFFVDVVDCYWVPRREKREHYDPS